MPRKSRQVILRNLIAEVVEQQERIEIGRVAEAERPPEVDACTFNCGFGTDESLDRSDGHGTLEEPTLSLHHTPARDAGVIRSGQQVAIAGPYLPFARFERRCEVNRIAGALANMPVEDAGYLLQRHG
jgi:hypothetical protein